MPSEFGAVKTGRARLYERVRGSYGACVARGYRLSRSISESRTRDLGSERPSFLKCTLSLLPGVAGRGLA